MYKLALLDVKINIKYYCAYKISINLIQLETYNLYS